MKQSKDICLALLVKIFLRIFIRIGTFFKNTEKSLHLSLEFFKYENFELF